MLIILSEEDLGADEPWAEAAREALFALAMFKAEGLTGAEPDDVTLVGANVVVEVDLVPRTWPAEPVTPPDQVTRRAVEALTRTAPIGEAPVRLRGRN